MSSQIVIIAGGLASRLGKISENKPKSLIQFNGIPFILHQIEYIKKQGIKKIHFCLGHFSEQIIEILDSQKNLQVEITYTEDGYKQLGTGGALKKALNYCEENFFVQYGDTYLPINYSDVSNYFKNRENKKSLMCIYKNDNMHDVSNVEFKKDEIFRYNKKDLNSKMKYIDYGLMYFNKKDLENYLLEDIFDFSEVCAKLITDKKMIPYEVNERFYEVGKLEGIAEMKKFFQNTNNL